MEEALRRGRKAFDNHGLDDEELEEFQGVRAENVSLGVMVRAGCRALAVGGKKSIHRGIDILSRAPDDVIRVGNGTRQRQHLANLGIQRKERKKGGTEGHPGRGSVGRPSFHLENADLGFSTEAGFGELPEDFISRLDR